MGTPDLTNLASKLLAAAKGQSTALVQFGEWPTLPDFTVMKVPRPEKAGLIKALLLACVGGTAVIQCADANGVEQLTQRFEAIPDANFEAERYAIGARLRPAPAPRITRGTILIVQASALQALANAQIKAAKNENDQFLNEIRQSLLQLASRTAV
jgi:hypothetical protein